MLLGRSYEGDVLLVVGLATSYSSSVYAIGAGLKNTGRADMRLDRMYSPLPLPFCLRPSYLLEHEVLKSIKLREFVNDTTHTDDSVYVRSSVQDV